MAKIPDSDDLLSIKFKFHPTLNEKKSKEAGRPIYDEIELCEIHSAGNRQTVWGFPALDYAPGFVADPNTGMRVKQTYAQKYNEQYLAFKNGAAQAQSGTPLDALPFLTPGKVRELNALHIHTAEALATIDGQPLKQLGMGGRELQKQAAAYLENATGPAALAVQQATNKDLVAQMEAMRKELDAIKGDAPVADAESPFESFDDTDIQNWLEDNGVQVDKRWSHKTLVEKADIKNAELAKQAKEMEVA